MALRGNLRDFSLPDVFQLVTFSRKTGVLRIVREDGATGSVWFRDGEVFFASSDWHSEPLGERLVKAQRITAQALTRALDLRGGEPDGGRRLGQILIDEGYITDKVLETFVAEQIQDTIFDLMRWDEGDFDFETMPEVVDEDIGLTVSIENVVMEGSRRLEEWDRIRKKIPSMEVVFKMATAPGEGTFEISLKPMEWQLLLRIDGTRSVADLARESGRTDFEVARILYGLFSAGLLEFATDEEIARLRGEREEREARLAVIEAERRRVAQAQAQAALEREAKLVEAAESRRAAPETAIPGAAEQEALREAIAKGPAEVPEFLGGLAMAPTADDQAALEEFMGAVLEHPAAPPAPPSEPMATPSTYVPAEEPAFMAASRDDDDGSPIAVPSAEDLFGDLVEVTSLEEQPLANGDFERGLLGMGLGELPPDMLEPISTPSEPEAAVPEVEPPADMVVSEPMSLRGEVEAPPWVDEPVTPAPTPEDLGVGLVDVAGLLGGEESGALTPEAAPAPSPVKPEPIASGEPDFAALLESLDVDAPDVAPTVAEGFDADLLLGDESEQVGGVISTDAFLGDVSMDELGFSGSLTDELSALTGAERRPAARPQASVNALPDEGSPILRRDARVDKETVLKIIEGIKGL